MLLLATVTLCVSMSGQVHPKATSSVPSASALARSDSQAPCGTLQSPCLAVRLRHQLSCAPARAVSTSLAAVCGLILYLARPIQLKPDLNSARSHWIACWSKSDSFLSISFAGAAGWARLRHLSLINARLRAHAELLFWRNRIHSQ